MQLDKTQIMIRERSTFDLYDLSLHVFRRFAGPLLWASLLAAAPLVAIDYWLTGWMMADVDFGETFTGREYGAITRYLWTITLLVYIQSPLISLLATGLLGQAVFEARPKFRRVLTDLRQIIPQIVWCLFIVRGAVPAMLLLLTVDRTSVYSPQEVFLVLLAIYVGLLRMLRPYLSEIVLLERNPLRSKVPNQVTVGRRSSILHASSVTLTHWLMGAHLGPLLAASLFASLLFISGTLLNRWTAGPWLIQFGWPLAMWATAVLFTVIRFLCYLDLRIRGEGWEVELRLRAEAARLAGSLT